MRLRYYIALSACALLSFSECEMQEEMWGKKPTSNTEVGALTLDVLAEEPISTKAAVSTSDFPIVIKGKDDNIKDQVFNYNSISEFPAAGLTLPTGTYIVSAHSNATLEKEMTKPYFQGEQEVEIQTKVNTQATVNCKMKNTKIEIALDLEFQNALSEWGLTINDGSNTAIYFSSTDSKRLVYYYFEGEVEKLTLNIRGKLKEDGNTIYDSMYLTKKEADEKYDDVSNCFEGGEALKINLTLSKATEGKITLSATASILFTNHTQEESVNVVFPGEEEETPSEPITPEEPSGEGVNMTCSAFDTGVTFSNSVENLPEDLTNIAVNITAPSGLASLKATIIAGNEGLNGLLEESLPFTNRELIGDTEIEGLLASVGVPIQMPTQGTTSYNFPIGQFFSMMKIYGPTVDADADETEYDPDGKDEHIFRITATDSLGNWLTKELKVKITK